MAITIEFSCGCEINETHVIAMCLKHSHDLAVKRLEDERRREEGWAALRKAVEREMHAPRSKRG